MSLQEQIELAQRSLRAMKRNPATRAMLPEYAQLQQAKAELDRAKARLKAAQALLGTHSVNRSSAVGPGGN